jgi:hypothetical protein
MIQKEYCGKLSYTLGAYTGSCSGVAIVNISAKRSATRLRRLEVSKNSMQPSPSESSSYCMSDLYNIHKNCTIFPVEVHYGLLMEKILSAAINKSFFCVSDNLLENSHHIKTIHVMRWMQEHPEYFTDFFMSQPHTGNHDRPCQAALFYPDTTSKELNKLIHNSRNTVLARHKRVLKKFTEISRPKEQISTIGLMSSWDEDLF